MDAEVTGNPEDFLVEERLRDLERLSAADLVMKMRDVESLSRLTTSPAERRRYAEVFRATGAAFMNASARMAREVPDPETPEYLREGANVPLRIGHRMSLIRRQAD